MKRNETILVYSVTGLLVVILGVAIAFGDGGVQASTSVDLKTLDQLQDAVPVDSGRGDSSRADGSRADGGQKAGPAPTTPGDGRAGEGAQPAPTVAPLNAESAPPAVTDVATRALVLLGESSRDGAYRIVSVRHGDTFSQLVQRWCASLDQMDVAASLNEEFDLGRLEPGTRLYLPWVEDEVLLTALERRKSGTGTPGTVPPGAEPGRGSTRTAALGNPTGLAHDASAVARLGAGQSQEYKIKPGDMLWNIAVARVGASKANKFIEAVRELNPDLRADPNRLVAGKTIVLPR